MNRTAFAIMAKAPAPEGVKTRMAPMLGPTEREALARALLEDRVDQLNRLAACDVFVAFTPDGARADLEALLDGRAELIPQRGDGLGERLHATSETLSSRGYERVLLVDADSALVPDASFAEASAALADFDVVLGPCWDGGYYLIGLSAPHAELFTDIVFSTRRVLSDTLARARAAGLSVHLLPSSYDVDEPDDLRRMADDLARGSRYRPWLPRRTAKIVESLTEATPASDRSAEPWGTVARRDVYRNPWIRVDERIVDLGDGQVTLYGVVDAGPCVGVLPQREDGKVLLVRQYRYVAKRFTWEMPTGGCRRGEAPLAAAKRELEEESGYRAERLTSLGSFHTSKSVMDEVAHLFVAENVRSAGHDGRRDPTEQIEVGFFDFDALMGMIDSGEIVDSMTIIAAQRLLRRRG